MFDKRLVSVGREGRNWCHSYTVLHIITIIFITIITLLLPKKAYYDITLARIEWYYDKIFFQNYTCHDFLLSVIKKLKKNIFFAVKIKLNTRLIPTILFHGVDTHQIDCKPKSILSLAPSSCLFNRFMTKKYNSLDFLLSLLLPDETTFT